MVPRPPPHPRPGRNNDSGWDSLQEPSRKGPRDKRPRAKGPGPRVKGVRNPDKSHANVDWKKVYDMTQQVNAPSASELEQASVFQKSQQSAGATTDQSKGKSKGKAEGKAKGKGKGKDPKGKGKKGKGKGKGQIEGGNEQAPQEPVRKGKGGRFGRGGAKGRGGRGK